MAGDVVTHPMSPISADRTSAAQNIPTPQQVQKTQKVKRLSVLHCKKTVPVSSHVALPTDVRHAALFAGPAREGLLVVGLIRGVTGVGQGLAEHEAPHVGWLRGRRQVPNCKKVQKVQKSMRGRWRS